jgi:hypothetical protein
VLRRSGLLTAIACACALAAASSAEAAPSGYAGTLSPPQVSADGRSVTAQVSVTATCDPTQYCGFFLVVTTVPATQPCAETISGSSWVGTVVSSPTYGWASPISDTELADWSEYPSLSSGAKHACLYAESASVAPVLVAQADYVVPAPPAPAPIYVPPVVTTPTPVTVPTTIPVPTPTVDDAIPQSLSRTEAVTVMRGWLKRKYGHRWTRGRQRVVKCPVRSSDAQLGCYGVWLYGRRAMARIEVVTETEDSYVFSKDFLSAPAQDDGGSSTTTADDGFCATHVCIPNYDNGTGSTVQCSDGSYSHSGGKQGACSHHGGVSHVMRRMMTASATRAQLASRLAQAVAAATSHGVGSNRG